MMALLNKEELEKEIISITESINAHEAQMKLHVYAIKVDGFLKTCLEAELEKLK